MSVFDEMREIIERVPAPAEDAMSRMRRLLIRVRTVAPENAGLSRNVDLLEKEYRLLVDDLAESGKVEPGHVGMMLIMLDELRQLCVEAAGTAVTRH